MLKGSLLVNSELAESNWYRYGLVEKRKFKELLNLARFNHSYRRMYAIEGTFNGLNAAPENDQLNKYPLSFHKRYRMVDMANQRDFVLVPPMKMDLIKGWVSLNLVEVINPADITVMTLDGDFVAQKLADLVNYTTEAEWTSGGSAPASGTPYFPPFAGKSLLPQRTFYILMNSGNSVTISALPNGAGNSPSISTHSDIVSGDLRTVQIQIGSNVAIGNLFRVTIYGRTLNYIVAPETRQNDGTKVGDNESFNYIF